MANYNPTETLLYRVLTSDLGTSFSSYQNDETLYSQGINYYQEGKNSKAIAVIQQAIILNPQNADYHNSLGVIYSSINNEAEAIQSFAKAVSLNPNNSVFHSNMGNSLKNMGYTAKAIKAYQAALKLKPDCPETIFNIANALSEIGEKTNAITCFKTAIRLKPIYPEAYNNLGNALNDSGQTDSAIDAYLKSLEQRPHMVSALNNIGNALRKSGRNEEAIDYYKRALSQHPDSAGAHCNLGNTYKELHRFDDALTSYQNALNIQPDFAEVHFNIAWIYLLQGDFDNGWEEYEWRLKRKIWVDCCSLRSTLPQWDGKSFKGKSLLVYDEQGYGDALQFIRYLSMVKALGGKLIIETRQPLVKLFSRIIWIDEIVVRKFYPKPAIEADLYIPMLSLPHIFSTRLNTIPAEVPYINADPGKVDYWASQMNETGHKVGLVWSGTNIDPNRTCPLNLFSRLASIPEIQFYSLQKKEDDSDIVNDQLMQKMGIKNLGDEFSDFDDTAAVIENLDLVISIDTSVAHLAGAMGKTIWVLLPYNSDWRWLMDRNDSPWYPTMRIFRQEQRGDWNKVLDKICDELQKEFFCPPESTTHFPDRLAHFFDFERGNCYYDCGDLKTAIHYYTKALELNPDNPLCHNNLGMAYHRQGEFAIAADLFRKAIHLKPDFVQPYYNMGNTFLERNKLDQMIEWYQKALDLTPDDAPAHNNVGKILKDQNRLKEAQGCFRKAIDLAPDYVEAHFNLALTHLIQGNFSDGWPAYEWRFKKHNRQFAYPHCHSRPRWDGTSFTGKTILVHGEQGFGDSIQFARYLPLVKARGGKVIFETHAPVLDLFASFQGIDYLTKISETAISETEFDMVVPLLSLPGLFQTTLQTIPARVPYVFADPAKIESWKARLSRNVLNIGIVWAGSNMHINDRNRSCRLDHFSSLKEIEEVQLYGMQKGEAASQIDGIEGSTRFQNLGHELATFMDTAGLISNLDLVITVDTAVAHLAGAMGKPVWVLLPFAPDWRWMLGRTDSPWYPTMRLFRQNVPGNWQDVVEKISAELKQDVAKLKKAHTL